MPSFSIRVAGTGPENTLIAPIYFPVLPGGGTLEEGVDLVFPRRGAHTENLFVFTTLFPFGFLEKTAMVRLKRETVVYPSINPLPEFEDLLQGITGELQANTRGLGTDFTASGPTCFPRAPGTWIGRARAYRRPANPRVRPRSAAGRGTVLDRNAPQEWSSGPSNAARFSPGN